MYVLSRVADVQLSRLSYKEHLPSADYPVNGKFTVLLWLLTQTLAR